MQRTKMWIAGGAAALLVAGTGAGIAGASGSSGSSGSDDDSEAPIAGQALDQASAAAFAETGGGRVTDTEAGDEESYYEVEVTLDDGSQVDVQLDRSFHVVDTMADEESPDDNDDNGQ